MNSKIKLLNERIDDVNKLGKLLLGNKGVYAGDNPTTCQVVEAIDQIPQWKDLASVLYRGTSFSENETENMIISTDEGDFANISLVRNKDTGLITEFYNDVTGQITPIKYDQDGRIITIGDAEFSFENLVFSDMPYKEIKSIKYVKTEDKRDVLEITLFKGEDQDDEQILEIELEFEGTNIKSFKNGLLTWNAEYQDNKLTKISDTNVDLSQYFVLGYGAAASPGEGVGDPDSEDYNEDYINENGRPIETKNIAFYTGPDGVIFKEIVAPVGDTIYLPAENPIPYEEHVFVGWYDQIDPDKETVQFPIENITAEKVFIAKYEKKYVDALYEYFNMSKQDFPCLGIILDNHLSLYIFFSQEDTSWSQSGSIVVQYGPKTLGYRFYIPGIEKYADFKDIFEAIVSTNPSPEPVEVDNTGLSNYYKSGISISGCKLFYTNSFTPSQESIRDKWQLIY